MAGVDMELRKAFQEHQTKMMNTQQQMKVHSAQIEALKRQVQRSQIVKTEISSLDNKTTTYLGVGRMFMLSPKAEVLKNLDSELSSNKSKIENMEKQNKYLERSIKEHEENLRELVASKRSK